MRSGAELDKCGTRARAEAPSPLAGYLILTVKADNQPSAGGQPRGGGGEGGGCHQFMGTAAAGIYIYIFPLPHGSIKAILRNAIRQAITLEMEQRALSAALTWAAKCALKSTSCWHV